MTDSAGNSVKVAYPGMAVTVSGWKTLPKAGDEVLDGKESEVKKALANRIRQVEIAASLADVDAINAVRKEERERKKAEVDNDKLGSDTPEVNGPKELKLIIKADVSGSAEAVEGALQGIGNKEAVTKVISSGVGDVTESDVLMAKAVNGMSPTDLVLGSGLVTDKNFVKSHHRRFLCVCTAVGRDLGSTECRAHHNIAYHIPVDGGCSTAGYSTSSYDQGN